jgi:hypothetical protein
MRSVPGADRGPHAGSPRGVVDATGSEPASVTIKIRQFIALPIEHVVNSPRDATLIPQVSFATLLGPGAVFIIAVPRTTNGKGRVSKSGQGPRH